MKYLEPLSHYFLDIRNRCLLLDCFGKNCYESRCQEESERLMEDEVNPLYGIVTSVHAFFKIYYKDIPPQLERKSSIRTLRSIVFMVYLKKQ